MPPPRNSGTPDTSISASQQQTWPPTVPWERKDGGAAVSEREGEAQKSKPTMPSTSPETAATKPKKSKLRPRKAPIVLTPKAVEQLQGLFDQPEHKMIRVGVKNRGCSGLAYHLEYVDKPGAFDETVEQDGVKVLIDSKALFSIIGSEMDWLEDKLSARFIFKNPNISAEHTRAMDERPVDIVVRFATSNSDIVLNIPKPGAISSLSLKQQIRAELDPPASTSRLRLIHAGKVLQDGAALSKSVKVTPRPPSRDENKSAKAKGKQPLRDIKPTASRVYIHCSIGDDLSASELATEAKHAEAADAALDSRTAQPESTTTTEGALDTASTTTPAPRGFDRLLSAGFSTAEVAALRTQFLAIQAHTHTPDTVPTGSDLLALEERWLDNTSNPSAAGGDGDAGGFGSEDAGGLEDMLYGNLIGFFWPIGAMCWLMREEGVWTRRRQIAVLSGFLVNVTFGFLRVMN
ncbi:hypothetical protein DOTSEDRAFT_84554 [Dothistroma septosporum NZE10]|uniref:Ubiquitin-like domain-containing protein n=1 Tax=Dothistroma septosporum (strain NZE10 / CBS 128990) TaxID=675120 RepID=N1Q010_DOTSN|nr:hypothetical protein DOTSEDRAFT_84554 [Dothistroma septosporum NZE10]